MKPTLLVVDDDEEIRTQMRWALGEDYDIIMAGERMSALASMKSRQPPVVLLDLGLPPRPNDTSEGMATLGAIHALDGTAKVIVVSGQGEKENALEAVGAGAYDFLCKPVNMDELRLLLRRSFHVAALEREYRENQLGADVTFERIVGSSSGMQNVFNTIRKVGPTTASVLILGESGTGKEMTALAIHNRSAQKEGAFVAINCNAIPENLLESELFGHEKGAFTGAHQQRVGLIETAHGGTLFLDEIGELPAPIQVKLLRFLQEQRIQRVGGRQEIRVDTRVIAATNTDIKEAIATGTFREDLFFRLAVVVLSLPPLRDRDADIKVLANEFLRRFAAQNGKRNMSFTPEAVRALMRHTWPGNVRELQNRVHRAVIMADGKRLTEGDLDLVRPVQEIPPVTLKDAREAVERELVQEALRKQSGNISAAAADLGISRPTLYEIIERLGIPRPNQMGH